MLIIISCVILIVVGIGLISSYDEGWKFIVGVILVMCFSVTLLVCGGIMLGENIAPEHKFERDMIEYQVLQYEEENGYITFAGNVIEYNQRILRIQKWANSPWLNWFYYDGCENLPYYEFDGFDLKGE